ncbi:glycosyltransferase family 2 protein [Pedobacter chinensis]|uniref:Glycosyltransferase family 2 protein n=1 Tax=Pedobacter chinensis TaxID=2282421 RepID=A0A369PVW3_9SPHI|nr:glycosyltransferase family A protein [Pedobacter chinensis]RDC54258.1 glycosyltransferase family 2 protein [Pedobacter chinensis]
MGYHKTKNRRGKMSFPLVSIIIPTYNYGHFILDALRSISAQSYTNWECIIIDDGSTDDTASIVAEYITTHANQHFEYIYISNAGSSNARNIGVEKSKGVYLQFLDADDLLQADKLAIQVKVMKSEYCALVFSKSIFFSSSNAIKRIYQDKYPAGFLATKTLNGIDLVKSLITNNIFPISSALVHKALVKNAGMFDAGSNNNEDWLIWFKIALLRPIFVFDDSKATGTEIRIHPHSMMGGKRKMFEGEVFVRNQIDSMLKDQFKDDEINVLKKYNQDLLALHRIRSLDIISGSKHVLMRFIHSPIRNFRLLYMACFKLTIRVLKK